MRHYVYDSYQEAEVLSASPLHLVRLLYRAAIEAIAAARRCLAARDIAGRTRAVNKALRIVTELAFSLDHQQGAELSRTLVELYDYVQRLLIDANCRQVDPPLAEAQKLLATLQEAWEHCEPAPDARASERQECEYAPVSCAG
ncbi:MAG: flagellar export chaperone FliS [Bryobacteraceae bacterium]|jgi:flagellar protein FliS